MFFMFRFFHFFSLSTLQRVLQACCRSAGLGKGMGSRGGWTSCFGWIEVCGW